MPASLNCPNCGAPSGESATSCDYCGSRLAAVACPACMGSMFVGAQYCPHCGAKVAEPERLEVAPLRCPGCGADMPGERLGSVDMHRCSGCGSAWLAPDMFATLCTDRSTRGVLAAAVGADGAVRTSITEKVRYVRCAVCDKTMNRVNFGRTSGIIVDVCKQHGVWFERDELRGVLTFVERGGFEQMRARPDEQHLIQQRAIGLYDASSSDGSTAVEAILFRVRTMSDRSTSSPLRSLLESLFT